MRRFIYFTLFFLGAPFLMFAQRVDNEYGVITNDEMQLTSCPYDKLAEAAVLFDIGSAHFEERNYAFEIMYERTTRIKIFNEAGRKWAQVEIPFYREGDIYEQIEDLEASTYNIENGSLIRTNLDLKTTFNEKLNNLWSLHKFALPNVKVGSIIEYRYKIRSQYVFKLRDWEFQWKIPVIKSKFSVRMVPFYDYAWLLQGATKFDSQQNIDEGGLQNSYNGIKFKNISSEFVMNNLSAFRDEEYLSSINDYIVKLHFQLAKVTDTNGTARNILSTWPELVKDFLNEPNFTGYMKKSQNMASKFFDLKSLASKAALERFDTVMNFVKTNYRWNNANGKYSTKSLSAFITDKYGNDAELNLFAIGLLNAVGIKATPVVLSTRVNGKIKTEYPFLDAFNYVAVSADIDGNIVLTDATDITNSNYRIPVKCINGSGLLIQKDKTDWISLQTSIPSRTRTVFGIDLKNESLNATVESSATEYDASRLRESFGSDNIVLEKYLEQKGYNVAESSLTIKNGSDCKKPYIYKFSSENRQEKINSKIYISPFLAEVIQENPLKQTSRTYPVDMIYPTTKLFYSQISIPDGYKADFIPENKTIDNEQFQLNYSIISSKDKIVVSFSYNFKSALYQPAEYGVIKSYFNEIVNKGTEKVVLSKQ